MMNAALFDWLKLRLDRLRTATGTMAADGSMQTWAEATSSAVIRAFEGAERFLMGYDRIIDVGNQGGTERMPGLFKRRGDLERRAGEAFDTLRRVLRPIVGGFDALDAAFVLSVC